MFGVLIVSSDDGRIGALKAFSGQISGLWEIKGWVLPIFDATLRLDIEPDMDRRIKALTKQMEDLAASPGFLEEREKFTALRREFNERRLQFKARCSKRRRARRRKRAELASSDRISGRLLDNESRMDDIERRQLDLALKEELLAASREYRRMEKQLRAMERLRRFISRRAMQRIHDTYRLTNARGNSATLRELFPNGEPPWGAGDCAAPKLLAFAISHRLRPVALAEFWWGPPPPGGGRVEGVFFPACRSKCEPVLNFLLDGIEVARRRTWKPTVFASEELSILHEDHRVVLVSKPAGLLSVPARDEEVTDSVQARLKRKYPRARTVLVVHRLDLDTSGVILAALDLDAYRFLQAQFAARQVEKRYVAWLEGDVAGESGTISLPMRPDLDQRPRQIVDFIHGREATTHWTVLERRDGRTRVAFRPGSGRSHQLRVHAAHRDGLGAPIVGDRLYGTPGERLMLHAETLVFKNLDGKLLTVTDPAPF